MKLNIKSTNQPKIAFQYNPEKGLAMLKYLLNEINGKYSYMALLKLAFFADRFHVRNYARPVSCDTYYALKLGALPSNLSNIIDNEDFLGIDITKVNKYEVKLVNKRIKRDEFSKSDIKAMRFAIDNFAAIGKKNRFTLAEITHAYPEWDKYRERFLANSQGREDMFYEDFLKNADPNHEIFLQYGLKDPFIPLTEKERKSIYEDMLETTLVLS